MSILIVSESTMERQGLSKQLQPLGLPVITAATISIAEKKYKNSSPILVVFTEDMIPYIEKISYTEIFSMARIILIYSSEKGVKLDNITSIKHSPTLHRDLLRFISHPPINKEIPKDEMPPPKEERSAPIPNHFSIVVIGVSTGGPDALNRLIPTLPALPVPILIVLHMPSGFTSTLVRQLSLKSPLVIKEGEVGQTLHPGHIYLAPGGKHMVLKQEDKKITIDLNMDPPVNSCRPAVDVLFKSVARCYGGKGVISIILTGMGSDGAEGVAELKKVGCYSITQSAESCVVYGMPKAVVDSGLSDKSLPLEKIPNEIIKRLG